MTMKSHIRSGYMCQTVVIIAVRIQRFQYVSLN